MGGEVVIFGIANVRWLRVGQQRVCQWQTVIVMFELYVLRDCRFVVQERGLVQRVRETKQHVLRPLRPSKGLGCRVEHVRGGV